jgi:O-antigen/teichoic acid export membrane protein
MTPELVRTFVIGFAVAPIFALHWTGSAVVRAFGGVVSALAPERIVREGLLVVLVGTAGVLHLVQLDASLIMAAMLISAIVSLCLVNLSLRRRKPPEFDSVEPAYDAREWRRSAIPLMLIAAAEVLISRTGIMLLGWNGDTVHAGIYALAFNMALLAALPRVAVNSLFAPAVSDLFVRKDYTALQTLVGRAAWLSLFGSACVAIPLLLMTEPLLTWFGPEFASAVTIIHILLVGQVFAAASGPQQTLLTMTGHERAGAILLIASAGANLALSALLIKYMGMTGAALATTATLLACNLTMAAFVYRRLGLTPGLLVALRGIKTASPVPLAVSEP